jgi:uncharacterized protein
MAELDKVLLNLIEPMVEDKDKLEVKELEGKDEKDVILCVYASNNDIAHLIGRKGSMASALRQVMSVAAHTDDKRISIKFEQK